MIKTKKILKVIQDKPGSTSYQIQCELEKQARTAKWVGQLSFLAAIVRRTTSATLYFALAKLEANGRIRGVWDQAPAGRGGRRPRLYYSVNSGMGDTPEWRSLQHH
jgi:DNA-binding PadR family transcriptional regulator